MALAATSKYRMWLPGRFSLSDGTTGRLNAGLVQTTLTVTADYKPFGWVKCSGRGAGRMVTSFTALNFGHPSVIAHADGELQGAGALQTTELIDIIGRISSPVPQITSETLVEIALTIVNRGPSFSREGEGHSGNTVNIT